MDMDFQLLGLGLNTAAAAAATGAFAAYPVCMVSMVIHRSSYLLTSHLPLSLLSEKYAVRMRIGARGDLKT